MYIGLEEYHVNVFGKFDWQYHDEYDTIAREAFRSLLLIGSNDEIQAVPTPAIKQEWLLAAKTVYNYNVTSSDMVAIESIEIL